MSDEEMRRSVFTLLDVHPAAGRELASVHGDLPAQARLAEELGFDTFWVAEHHFTRLGTAANPAVVLASLARATQRIGLGPAVAVLPLRDPRQVAEDYALVDVISNGRLRMGVGCGSREEEFAGFGLEFDTRYDVLREHMDALRAAWAAASRDGARGVAPLQDPPPLFVATNDAARARSVGEEGDSLLTIVSPGSEGGLEKLAESLDAWEQGRAQSRSSRATGAEAIVAVFAHVGGTAGEARSTAASALARLVEAMSGVPLLDPEQAVDDARDSGTALFCGVDELDEAVGRFHAIGARHLALVTEFGAMPRDAAARSMRRLAPRAGVSTS